MARQRAGRETERIGWRVFMADDKTGPVWKLDTHDPNNHYKEFVNCVKTRKQPDVNAGEGHISSSLAHLANVSLRLGRAIDFDPATERVKNDPAADRMMGREYRKPFVITDQG